MTTNGHPRGLNGPPEKLSLAELKTQVRETRLRVKLRQLQAQESVLDGTQEFVNPAEPLFDSPDFIYPWYGENIPFNLDNRLRGELLPIYITEYGLKILRDYSRWMLAYNPWAIQIRKNKIAYICGKGFGYTCAPVDRTSEFRDGDRQLCKIAQRYLDRFMERTNWGAWEQQLIWKDVSDGEAFLRFFHLGNGEVTVRPVEPEHVRSPGNQMASQSFGIQTPEDDILDVQGFWIVENPSQWWYPTLVPATEVLHIRSNVGPTAKRGYPCLIPVRQNLSRAANLLKIMSILASSQSSISMIRKWKQYSVADIQGFQANNSDFQYTDPLSGQQRFIKRYLPGTALDAPENVDYEFPASQIAAAQLVMVLQAELRAIASCFNWPEYMVGADASNANYASSQVAEAPGVKQMECEQAAYARAFGDGTFAGASQCGALWRVLYLGIKWGGLPREILRRVKLQAEGPSLVARDKDKETARAEKLYKSGVLSIPTWSKWEGLDRAQEKEQGAEEKQEQPPMIPGEENSSPGIPRIGNKVRESKDASGHEHDPHSGQFTGPGGGGSAGKPDEKKQPKKLIFQRGEEIAKQHYGNARAIIGDFKKGRATRDQALARLQVAGEKAVDANKQNFSRRYKAFKERMTKMFGEDAILSQEWDNVYAAFKDSRNEINDGIEGLTSEARQAIKSYAKHGRFMPDDLNDIAVAHDTINDLYSRGRERVGQAIDVFRFKFRPVSESFRTLRRLLAECRH